MLKGDIETCPAVISTIIYVNFVIALVLFLTINVIGYGSVLVTSQKDLNAIDGSHMAENCLKEGARFIQKNRLDEFVSEGKDSLCEIESCGICGTGIGVKITDLETSNSWNFGYKEDSNHKHSIYINIQDGNDVHIGRLYVSV